MMTLKNLRTEIKEEVGGVTKHAPQFNYLKVAPDVTAALNILLSDQIPHFLGYAESIKEISSTLIKYHASL